MHDILNINVQINNDIQSKLILIHFNVETI